MEDEWCMERRCIAHDKVDHVMIRICLLVLIAYENNLQKKQQPNCATKVQPTDKHTRMFYYRVEPYKHNNYMAIDNHT